MSTTEGVTSAQTSTLRGPRLFATSANVPRMRRATDVILLGTSAIGLVLLTISESPQPGFARAVGDVLLGLPPFLDGMWQITADLVVITALTLLTACLVRRRWAIARDLVAAAVVALTIAAVAARVIDGVWPDLARALGPAGPPSGYPAPRLAVAAAVVITAAPHLTLPFRRLGRWVLAVGALSVVALGAGTVLGTAAGLLVAAVAASTVHLALGSSAGRPSLSDVSAALAELGVAESHRLSVAADQSAGVFTVVADPTDVADATGALVVKVYGRDAHGAAIVSALWRTVWFREPTSSAGFGRRQQVEHEAFLTLLARQAGVATDAVVTAATTADDDALLVLRRTGRAITDDEHDATHVEEVWSLLDRLHAAGISHGQVDRQRLTVVPAGSPADSPASCARLGITDFRAARSAPSRLERRTDQVQAFVTQIEMLGENTAFEATIRSLGAEGMGELLPLLQPATLTPAQRRRLRAGDIELDAVRQRAAEAAGVELPPQLQLRRFTWGSIARIALPAVALFALVATVAGLDVEALGTQFGDATWWLVALGAVVSQLPRLTQSISTLGASPVPLPLGPVYALQLAVSYINLAIPSSAARMAINIRFFQRHGVPPGGALAAGAIDGMGGFVMQVLVLIGFLLTAPVSLELGLDPPTSGSSLRLVLIVVAIGLVAAGVVVAVRRLRRFVFGWVRQLATEAIAAIRGLRSPRRLAMLLGGNLATDILFALALGTFTRAFGASVGLGELLFVVISVSLLAGLMPVPGGIGVTEGGLIYGLIAVGLSEEVAFASVISYRLATFYLPPIWGFFALRWLERNQHV